MNKFNDTISRWIVSTEKKLLEENDESLNFDVDYIRPFNITSWFWRQNALILGFEWIARKLNDKGKRNTV